MSAPTPLCLSNVTLDGIGVGVRCAAGRIVEVGPGVAALPGDEVLDGGGMAVLPGLVNGHTHAAMTLLRGYGDDLPLMEWLQTRIWPAEAALDAHDVYWGTRLAAIEMLRSGTTHFFDMYWHVPAVARAASDTGIRATVSGVFIDAGTDDPHGVRAAALEDLDAVRAAGGTIEASLGPHAVYTVTRDSLEWLAGVATERDVPVHIHLSETSEEVERCVSEHGCTPPALLDAAGLLGPSTLCAHGNWLTAGDLELLADRGATVVTNPVSNLKLATGKVFDYTAARRLGIPVGLGTDGAASNNSLDLLGDVKIFALVNKQAAGDPAVLPASEALEVASGGASPLLGGRCRLGPGDPADLILVRTDGVEMTPSPLPAALVYATSGAAVDTAVVAGRVVMRNREVPGTEEVIAEVRSRAARLRSGT